MSHTTFAGMMNDVSWKGLVYATADGRPVLGDRLVRQLCTSARDNDALNGPVRDPVAIAAAEARIATRVAKFRARHPEGQGVGTVCSDGTVIP